MEWAFYRLAKISFWISLLVIWLMFLLPFEQLAYRTGFESYYNKVIPQVMTYMSYYALFTILLVSLFFSSYYSVNAFQSKKKEDSENKKLFIGFYLILPWLFAAFSLFFFGNIFNKLAILMGVLILSIPFAILCTSGLFSPYGIRDEKWARTLIVPFLLMIILLNSKITTFAIGSEGGPRFMEFFTLLIHPYIFLFALLFGLPVAGLFGFIGGLFGYRLGDWGYIPLDCSGYCAPATFPGSVLGMISNVVFIGLMIYSLRLIKKSPLKNLE